MYLTPGERILIERRRQRMTVAELAKQVDVSPATISSFEYGDTAIGMETLAKICKVLGVSIHYVVSGPKNEDGKTQSIFPDGGVDVTKE